MKFVFAFLATIIFASCSATPAQLASTSADLRSIQQVAATQPGGHTIADNAGKAAEAIDIAAPVVAALNSQTTSNDKLTTALNNLSAITSGAAVAVHAAAPSTPADNYTSLAAVLVLGLSKIVSSVQSRKSIESVSTGTTPAPVGEPAK